MVRLTTLQGSLWCVLACVCARAGGTAGGAGAAGEARRPHVEVRAVLIHCDNKADEASSVPESVSNFDKEELYRHSAVRDCRKKITLTLRLKADPDNYGEEFISVEHAYDPLTRDNVLLLNPYVVKLVQEPVLQAYKITHLMMIGDEQDSDTNQEIKSPNYHQTDSMDHLQDEEWRRKKREAMAAFTIDNRDARYRSFSMKVGERPEDETAVRTRTEQRSGDRTTKQNPKDCGLEVFTDPNERRTPASPVTQAHHKPAHRPPAAIHHRVTHHKSKTPETTRKDTTTIVDPVATDPAYRAETPGACENLLTDKISQFIGKIHFDNPRKKREHLKMLALKAGNASHSKLLKSDRTKTMTLNKEHLKQMPSHKETTKIAEDNVDGDQNTDKINSYKEDKAKARVSEYDVYSVGLPALWYSVSIQVFEKLSAPDSSAVWSDVTGGSPVSVGSLNPDVGDNLSLSVRYSAGDCLQREHYLLPAPDRLLLLVPDTGERLRQVAPGDNDDFLVVPASGVESVKAVFEEPKSKHGWMQSFSKQGGDTSPQYASTEMARRLLADARPLRSLYAGAGGGAGHALVRRGGDSFLALRHARPHHAQLDVEACADGNEMLRRDSPARVTSVVVDSSREKRSIITVHVANTGLLAASFRAVLSDCPASMSELAATAVLPAPAPLPPRHTRQLHIELTGPLPEDSAQCAVGIFNSKDELAAIRRFTIQKRDRCFCIWHCKCACLGLSPQLACEPLPQEQLVAAGLAAGDAPRRARAACYSDNRALDALLLLVGLMFMLLVLGVLKGLLGLFWPRVSAWGLERLVELPRQIDMYYEPWLRHRTVLYDCSGWPVHPDTKRRTVRLMSMTTELCLNSVFFLTFPCAVLWTCLWLLTVWVCPCRAAPPHRPPAPCYAWTQRAEIDKQRLLPSLPSMEGGGGGGGGASDAEDTADDSDTKYVLTQMQKSKESLSRSQKKRDNTSEGLSPRESRRDRR